MDLAYGFIAQALKTHDDLMAARIQEQRRAINDRIAEGDQPSGIRPSLMRRLIQRSHRLGARAGQDIRGDRGLRAAH